MLVVTTKDIPGYKIEAVIGEVMGLTARTMNFSAGLNASFRAMSSGGEIPELTQLAYDSRNQVIDRMWQQCVQRGGNAVVRMRFITSSVTTSMSEVCAYGTAVVVRPLAADEPGSTTQSAVQAQTQVEQ